MVRHDCVVSHAILAEFVLELLDVRRCERAQPPERAIPVAVGCRKFTKRSDSGRRPLLRILELRFAPGRWRRAASMDRRAARGRSSRARSDGGLGALPKWTERNPTSRPYGGDRNPALETGTIEAARGSARRTTTAADARRITILMLHSPPESRNTRATSGASAIAPSRAGARKTLAERRIACIAARAGARNAGRSARLKSGRRSRCADLRSLCERARGPLRVPAGASRSARDFTAIFIFEPFHQ